MRMRALGTAPARPVATPRTPPAADTGPATLYAGVSARDGNGAPTRIEVPAPLAGRQVPLYVNGPRGQLWAGAVAPGGQVVHDFRNGSMPDKELLGRIGPGARIQAVTDSNGRVIALTAKVGKRW